MKKPIVEIQGVWFSVKDTPVLEAVNLVVEEGDYLGLIGPNGSGKTTLLRIMLGLIDPDQGTVRLFGDRPARARGRVGYVPQYARFDADFPMSVLDVVLMGRMGSRKLGGRLNQQDRDVAMTCLEKVEMVKHARRQIGRLSGGELQRVLIARALAIEPRLLLLDEPTASLDTRVGVDVYELLKELSREVTLILVSHDIGVISRYVKSVACLNRRLYYHHSKEITREMFEAVYGCPVDLVAHGHAHRVYPDHESTEAE
jgi:zinc transport system ATP-binding protein